MTLFGIRVSVDVIEVKVLRSSWIRVVFKFNNKYLYKKQKKVVGRWRQKLELCSYKPKNAKDWWQLGITQEWFLSDSLQKEPALLTPWLCTFGLQNYQRVNLCCFKPPVCDNLLQQISETNTLTIFLNLLSQHHCINICKYLPLVYLLFLLIFPVSSFASSNTW